MIAALERLKAAAGQPYLPGQLAAFGCGDVCGWSEKAVYEPSTAR